MPSNTKLKSLMLFPACLAALAGPMIVQAVPDATGAVTSVPTPNLSEDAVLKARLNYNIAYELIEKSRAAPHSSASLKGAKLKAAQQQRVADLTQARTRLEIATETDPQLKEAWNLLGFARRNLGLLDAALLAYDKALALDAGYAEAIEYRAEALLGLNRFEEVKSAYLTLFATSPGHAATLLHSLRDFLAAQKKSKSIDADELNSLELWVAERENLAKLTHNWRGDSGSPTRWN